jgi:hypothetical protein
VLLAFAIAPPAAPIAYAAGIIGITIVGDLLGLRSAPSLAGLRNMIVMVGLIGIPVAYGAALTGGVPVYFLLRSSGLLSRQTLWLGGGAIGFLTALLFTDAMKGDLFSIRLPWWTGALLGVISTEAFWRVLCARR